MSADSEPLLRKRRSPENSAEGSNNMEARAEHKAKRNFVTIFTVSTGVMITLFILLLVWLNVYRHGFAWSDPNQQFNWHPLLMVLGMVCLFSQALLIFRVGRNYDRKIIKYTHLGLHGGAFVSSIIGLVAGFYSHKIKQIPDLYTLHSWIGLSTVILYGIQFAVGVGAFVLPVFPNSIKAAILPVHVNFGVCIFLGAIIATMTGLMEKVIWVLPDTYKERPAEAWIVNTIGLLILIFAMLVVYLVHAPEYKRESIRDDQIPLQSH